MKTICKAATMTKCYPLSGGWVSSRNYWNNRAAVIECKGGYTALQSYNTIVCVLYRGKLYRTWGGYSRTTANHISRFCDMNGLRRISKKEWENMPVFDTAIESLNTEFEYNYSNPYMCDYFTSFKIIYPKKVGV